MSRVRGLVIIGGGAAGIGAGLEARARGIDSLIVEAGNRLGGRAHSIGTGTSSILAAPGSIPPNATAFGSKLKRWA